MVSELGGWELAVAAELCPLHSCRAMAGRSLSWAHVKLSFMVVI